MVVTYKDLHEMLPFALHTYRTAVRTSIGATPYTLVFWNGGGDAFRSRNPLIESIDRL
jgi:hypothetical protein